MNRWRAARSGWWVHCLLAALLWLPLMGALHQVVHGGSPSASVRAELVELGEAQGANLVKAFAGLFSAHGSDADCRVFDQLSHGPSLGSVAAAALPPLPVATFLSARSPVPPDLASAVPTARGPPVLA